MNQNPIDLGIPGDSLSKGSALERAFTILALAIGFTPKNKLQLGAIMGGLIMMKLLRPDLYRKAKHGQLTLSEAKTFLRFQPDEYGSSKIGWEEKWWIYLLSEEIPKELEDFASNLASKYTFRNRPDVIRNMANEVIDRLAPA